MTRDIQKTFMDAYDLYADAIYRHCFFRVSSKQKAEDFTQETFAKMWTYLAEGNAVQNIRALLYRIATNLIIDDYRKKKEEHLDALLENDQIAEPSYAGHEEIEMGATRAAVLEKIRGLPEDECQLILMRYIDDLDPKEIAEVLGITANNVSVKLNRAMKLLKESM